MGWEWQVAQPDTPIQPPSEAHEIEQGPGGYTPF